MGETGLVMAAGDSDGNVTINMKRSSACSGCKVCITGESEKEMVMVARNLCGAEIGDTVEVELKGGSLTRAAAIMYGVPLVGLLAGVWAGSVIFANEFYAFVLGIGIMGLGFLTLRFTEKKRDRSRYMPMAVRKVERVDI